MFRVGLYARVFTNDQQTLLMQTRPERAGHCQLSGRGQISASVSMAFLVALSLALVMARQSAAQNLIPRTSLEGKFLDLDFPAVHIGIAEYEEGPTGATVF